MVRERILVSLDSSVRGLDIRGLERRLANYQGVNDDAQRPDVYLVGVACPALQHFRCDVVRCSANGPLLLAVKIELGGKTEISQLDLHLVVEE